METSSTEASIGLEAQQNFTAVNILFPVQPGRRQYHRVIIVSSPEEIATDLTSIVDSVTQRAIRRAQIPPRGRFHQKLKPSNPARDEYTAWCSCGQEQCEHLGYAVSHFDRVQNFSHWFEQFEKARIERELSDERIKELERKIEEVGRRRDQQDRDRRTDVEHLMSELAQEQETNSSLQQQLDVAKSNLEAVWETWSAPIVKPDREMTSVSTDQEQLEVFSKYFALRESGVTHKQEQNVKSSHHRANPRAKRVATRLADIHS